MHAAGIRTTCRLIGFQFDFHSFDHVLVIQSFGFVPISINLHQLLQVIYFFRISLKINYFLFPFLYMQKRVQPNFEEANLFSKESFPLNFLFNFLHFN